jgi:hypothetical protein
MTENNLLAVGRKADWGADIAENGLAGPAQAGNRVEDGLVFVLRITVLEIDVIAVGRKRGTADEKSRTGRYDLGLAASGDLFDPEALMLAALDKSDPVSVGGNHAINGGSVLGELGDLHVERIDEGLCGS